MISDDGIWCKFDGASDDQIRHLISTAGFEIPDTYVDLLRYSNGGEGPLEKQPYNLVLYSISEVLDAEFRKNCENQFPGYFVIGGNGAGEYIALEIKTKSVVALDCVNNNISESRLLISTNFTEFIKIIGIEGD